MEKEKTGTRANERTTVAYPTRYPSQSELHEGTTSMHREDSRRGAIARRKQKKKVKRGRMCVIFVLVGATALILFLTITWATGSAN